MLVDIDMSKLSDKTERLNICLSSRALRRLDSLAANLAKTIFSLKEGLKKAPDFREPFVFPRLFSKPSAATELRKDSSTQSV